MKRLTTLFLTCISCSSLYSFGTAAFTLQRHSDSEELSHSIAYYSRTSHLYFQQRITQQFSAPHFDEHDLLITEAALDLENSPDLNFSGNPLLYKIATLRKPRRIKPRLISKYSPPKFHIPTTGNESLSYARMCFELPPQQALFHIGGNTKFKLLR